MTDLRARAAADEVDEETYERQVRELLAEWPLDDILQLRVEAWACDELRHSNNIEVNEQYAHVVFPYVDDSEIIALIAGAPKKQRQRLRKTLLGRLRDHLKAPPDSEAGWPKSVSPLCLAMSLDAGELFPADGLAAMVPKDVGAFRSSRHTPIPFPEPELGDWLRQHMQEHIERSIAGKKALAARGPIWLDAIVHPSWATSSLLTIVAYEMGIGGMSLTYDRIKEEPSLAGFYQAMPDMVRAYEERNYHPDTRAAARALWQAAQAARRGEA